VVRARPSRCALIAGESPAVPVSAPQQPASCRNWLMRFPDKLDVLAVHARLIA
jgi:hypothetical protein